MKRMGMAILALGLMTFGVRAQQAPAKAPTTPPAKAPAATTQAKPPAASATPAQGQGLKTAKEKNSYAIGMEMGKGLKSQGMDLDSPALMQGLKDALTDAKPQMSEDELRQVITALQTEMRQKQMQAQEAAAAVNKTKGDAFLAANEKKEGVVVLPDGLQYKILTAGTGKKPVESDTVLCNYKGTFIDGQEFDSSAQAGKPVPFEVKNVIPGFKEVLQMMPVGSKWQVFIPSNLAYGERGAGGVIGPNSTLVFEIEVVGIDTSAGSSAPSAPTPAK
ncbi:MAG TPA: FKBP-type peptidyl-prolyl cis-trans isomerase N-terminal domain-containing protein [Candidatus Acidoferrales bacterium]|jgi:FKBP-type peptidyl-prolyl cis-trans isomerase|nr:FKBP-type peptidyl-prolyl cis-trans isomerase N-terminal domain-containing protein [Candidatus Acidoferrales bacterium]